MDRGIQECQIWILAHTTWEEAILLESMRLVSRL
jgi:hypothetical protein